MGNHVGRRDHSGDLSAKNTENRVVEEEKPVNEMANPVQECEDNEVFADVNQNNGTSSKDTAVTDSTSTEDPKNDWKDANPADAASRPHLVRLFSRDAPGREDNTFKDRPSESDELQTIPEDSGTTSPETDLMASQKQSRTHGSKQMASASTSDHHSRHGHGAHGRYRDSGILDSLGRLFGGERHVPRKGKDVHLSRSGYLSSSPQRSYYAHGRHVDENPVVHFFRNMVTPRTPPPSQPKRGKSLARFSWGGEGHRACYGGSSPRFFEHHKSSHKGYKDAHRDGQGTLSRIFKLGGRDSRSSSPMARR
ncbi:myelin basic protein isoform X1 [Bufo gargarizans]|uniref:myelin basic protein isoform X1 n=2 Tax=Bufo gargarizans TaxID=30331 RepID=UPI001CF4EC2C|nr:myelin basic protein isoform X1 [Bufo gargarizans]XP_044148652.1 myelin basic protein isoform X1 [Bufo gargarizans]